MKLEMHFFICFYEAGLSSREFLCFRTSPRRLEIFVCDSTLDLDRGRQADTVCCFIMDTLPGNLG